MRIVAVGNDAQFGRFVEVLGCPELAGDERFATNSARVHNRDALVPLLQRQMLERGKEEWLEILEQVKVPAGPINSIAEVFAEPQRRSAGWVIRGGFYCSADIRLWVATRRAQLRISITSGISTSGT